MKKHYLIGVSVSCILWLTMVTTQVVRAEQLKSDSYIIQFGDFNVTSGSKSGELYHLTDTVGQTANGPYGQYQSSSYFVGGGNQYFYQIDEFSFSISDTSIEFGDLLINTHSTAQNTLAVTTKGAGGYAIYAYEKNPLQHTDGATTIDDTTCDDGNCTHLLARPWTNESVTGFGYNIQGNDVPAGFTDATYFKQFANNAGGEPMQAVMSSENVGANRYANVTYKVGVDAQQQAGFYQTHIVFVAVPGY